MTEANCAVCGKPLRRYPSSGDPNGVLAYCMEDDCIARNFPQGGEDQEKQWEFRNDKGM